MWHGSSVFESQLVHNTKPYLTCQETEVDLSPRGLVLIKSFEIILAAYNVFLFVVIYEDFRRTSPIV